MDSIAIRASGMVTAVGLNSASSCAAIRCAIDNFTETQFIDRGGEWIIGAQVELVGPWRGMAKLLQMVLPAIRECLAVLGPVKPQMVPLFLCVAERDRPGRVEGLDSSLLSAIQSKLGFEFHGRSGVVARGRIGGAIALGAARELINQGVAPACLIAGVDSYLVSPTLAKFEGQDRLLTSSNSNGFIPGEAGAAILVTSPSSADCPELLLRGIGIGQEEVTSESEKPLRADGLVKAIQDAFKEAGRGYENVDYRLTDANGEHYWFKETALAMTRTLRIRKEVFELWHPADCIGETGAAAVLCALGVALSAVAKSYAPGPGVLCHFGNDIGERVALLLETRGGRN